MNDVQALCILGLKSLSGQTENNLKKIFKTEIKKAHEDNRVFGQTSEFTAAEVKEAYTLLLTALRQGRSLEYAKVGNGFGGFSRKTRENKVLSFNEFKSTSSKELIELDDTYLLYINMEVSGYIEKDGKVIKTIESNYMQRYNRENNIFYFDVELKAMKDKGSKVFLSLDKELVISNLELDFNEVIARVSNKIKLITYSFVFTLRTDLDESS